MASFKAVTASFSQTDRAQWQALWDAYLAFYEASLPEAAYETTWRRIVKGAGPVYGIGLRLAESGELIGIAHYLMHASAWTARELCYLQDLYVVPEYRKRGHARRLVEAVAQAARKENCEKLYWTTHESNATARSLYDAIATYNGFLRYDYALR